MCVIVVVAVAVFLLLVARENFINKTFFLAFSVCVFERLQTSCCCCWCCCLFYSSQGQLGEPGELGSSSTFTLTQKFKDFLAFIKQLKFK